MTPWLLITVLLAVINLAAFLAAARALGPASSGSWPSPRCWARSPATRSGAPPGWRSWCWGDYHVLAACIGAQLLMLGTLLLLAMLPTADERAESNSTDR